MTGNEAMGGGRPARRLLRVLLGDVASERVLHMVRGGPLSAGRALAALSAVLLLAFYPILRASYLYIDDMGRAFSGYDGWGASFSRYLSDFLSHIVHASSYLSDVSPIPQLLAILLLAGSCLIVVGAVRDSSRFDPWDLVAVAPLALSPYFLECISYKYDAPYMALSIFISLVPLLARDLSRVRYGILTALCTLGMCMTYQASSGVFPMAVLLIAYCSWLRGRRAADALSFAGVSAVSYLAGVLVFYLFVMKRVDGYVSNGIAGPAGVLANYRIYFMLVATDLKRAWLLLGAGLIGWFVASSALSGGRRPLRAGALALLVALAMLLLSFGLYPLLQRPLTAPRAMYGIGVFVALVAVGCAARGPGRWVTRALAVALAWSLFAFAATYGNALAQQDDWTEFRIEEVANDLSEVDAFVRADRREVQIRGTIGLAPSVRNSSAGLNILQRLVPVTFRERWTWGRARIANYYGLADTVWVDSFPDTDPDDFTLVQQSTYHTVYADGDKFIVELR